MKLNLVQRLLAAVAMLCATAPAALAAEHPAPREGDFTMRSFHFQSGEVLPDVKVHYRTIGDPAGEPVLVLHGTAGSGASMLAEGFAGALFGPGQPLDANRHFIILPDAIGTGRSTRPSDGLRARFPKYNQDDMVHAQYRLLSEHLGIKHLRLVIGNSMGGMQTWLWGIRHPDFMDALVPLASLPAPMSGRNWMMRRMLIDSVVTDPAWKNGDYTEQPPNYDPSADLEKITAPLLAINAADDERNPPELGIFEREMKRIPKGRVLMIPASAQTSGHGTTGSEARLYARELAAFLKEVPRRSAP